jgi:hypothetical protein
MTGPLKDSRVWDVLDCAPVLTQDQIDDAMDRAVPRMGILWMTRMLARLGRLIATAKQIEKWRHEV